VIEELGEILGFHFVSGLGKARDIGEAYCQFLPLAAAGRLLFPRLKTKKGARYEIQSDFRLDRAADLLEAFSTTPATTLAGVAGKLDAVLREGEAWKECSEFSWPQVRSALSDLVRIAQQMMPDRSFTVSSIPSSASDFSRDPVNLQRSVCLTFRFNRQ
ncbi:hypothetical protein NKI08_34255, partial [Mesorhizobium sp. M0768]